MLRLCFYCCIHFAFLDDDDDDDDSFGLSPFSSVGPAHVNKPTSFLGRLFIRGDRIRTAC